MFLKEFPFTQIILQFWNQLIQYNTSSSTIDSRNSSDHIDIDLTKKFCLGYKCQFSFVFLITEYKYTVICQQWSTDFDFYKVQISNVSKGKKRTKTHPFSDLQCFLFFLKAFYVQTSGCLHVYNLLEASFLNRKLSSIKINVHGTPQNMYLCMVDET